MIIDVHTHIFPDTIAEEAVRFLAKEANSPYFLNGKKSDLLESMQKYGITQSWLQPVATKPKQVPAINAMMKEIKAEHYPKLVPFGSVHPDCADLKAIIRDLAASGIPGVKFHPEYHKINPTDSRLYPMYEALAEENMVILFHAGLDIGIPTINSTPKDFMVLIEKFPTLTMILAHMGGFKQWDEVFAVLAGTPVYLDTSYTKGYLADDDFVRLVSIHGAEKIVFGTDSPWSDQQADVDYIHPFASHC